MSHLENLLAEYYDWKGYLVKRNIKVSRLAHGGWGMELDIVAYEPHSRHLIHLEPSLDAHTWKKREERFAKKFRYAKEHIFSAIFTWLPSSTPLEQVAILNSHPKDRDAIGGGRIESVDEVIARIRRDIVAEGVASKSAISEQYQLLRTIQMCEVGYIRAIRGERDS